MAKLFGSQIDLQKIPVLNLVVHSSPSEPPGPVNGMLWFDTTAGVMKVREAGGWLLVANAAGGSTPTGPAGGDLTGSSYPNPVIAANAVTTAKINDLAVSTAKLADGAVTSLKIADATITDTDVAAANKDGAVGTPSLRTLGLGAAQAMPGNTALSAITVPAADLNLNSKKITALADPAAATDAANKQYVDGVAQGLDAKQSVWRATTGTITLSGTQAIDGVTVSVGERVLVKNQATPSQNGIYVVAAGAWSRATDMDAWAEVPGAFVFVEGGTVNGDTGWVCTADPGGAIGSTPMPWTQFSGAGAYTAGAGLTLTGIDFAVGGTTNRITVGADAVDIAATYVGQTSITTLGTVTAGTWQGTDIAVTDGGTGASTAAAARTNLGAAGKVYVSAPALSAGVAANLVHNLGTVNVVAQFYINATMQGIEFDYKVIDGNTVAVTADVAYAASAILAVVIG